MVLDISWNETTNQLGHQGVRPIHLSAIIFGSFNFILNGLVCHAFIKTPSLLSKHHLYLFYAFSVTNFFTGFEIALDRIRHILTVAIACERIYALFKPGDFYFVNQKLLALRISVFAIVWSLFDAIFLIFEDGLFTIRIHCVTTSASGPLFHTYFLLSTIFFGILLTVCYFVFICKLYVLKGTQIINKRSQFKDNFRQVNSLTVMVILMVVIFNVLPSALYLYDVKKGKVHFMKWGPIVTIGYHCYGILSVFFYNGKHKDIKAAMKVTWITYVTVPTRLEYTRNRAPSSVSLIAGNYYTSGDSDGEVRDASYQALGSIMRIVGEKVATTMFEGVDKSKMEKIKEICDAAIKEVGPAEAKKAPPPKAPEAKPVVRPGVKLIFHRW